MHVSIWSAERPLVLTQAWVVCNRCNARLQQPCRHQACPTRGESSFSASVRTYEHECVDAALVMISARTARCVQKAQSRAHRADFRARARASACRNRSERRAVAATHWPAQNSRLRPSHCCARDAKRRGATTQRAVARSRRHARHERSCSGDMKTSYAPSGVRPEGAKLWPLSQLQGSSTGRLARGCNPTAFTFQRVCRHCKAAAATTAPAPPCGLGCSRHSRPGHRMLAKRAARRKATNYSRNNHEHPFGPLVVT